MTRALWICLALTGCSPCSDGYMLVSVSFSGYTADADYVDIDTVAGTQRLFHPRGEPTQVYEIPSSSFVRVTALRGGQSIAVTSKNVTPIQGCTEVALDLAHGETHVPVENAVKNKADILFVIDDTAGPFQTELRARFAQFAKILDDFGKENPGHYHLGVITSDMGAGPFTLGGGQCKPGGRGGKLQPLGAGAAVGCQGPTPGLNFIDYNQRANTSNLPMGQDLTTTFNCMAAVGSKGCGFEQPLEAAYRALHDIPVENHDFLRPDAQLYVLFLTEEDDCSADNQSDIFDPAKTAEYGPLMSYRCTQFGVACDGKLPPYDDSHGLLHNCVGATAAQGGKLTDVQKYIDFFKNPAAKGGLKLDPSEVFLAGITAESNMGISTHLVWINPNPPGPPMPCGPPDGVDCVVVLQHSCINPHDTRFFGDPAVRLNQVVRAMPPGQSQVTSVCDTSYQAGLEAFGARMVSSIGSSCITAPLPDPSAPDCIVEDGVSDVETGVPPTRLPRCGAPPCWRLESSSKCGAVCASDGAAGQRFEIKIDRGPGVTPPVTPPSVRCTTVNVDPDRPARCAP